MSSPIALLYFATVVVADRGPWGGGNRWSGGGNEDEGGDGRGGDFGTAENGFGLGSMGSFDRANTILIAHAVIASAVWVLFVPWAALLLRINIKSPVVLKLHALLQIVSYLLYIAAAGLGVWLARQTAAFGIWEEAHPRLGLAILAIAFFQPILGLIHHRIFKKRSAAMAAGGAGKPPGRTMAGHVHIWVGRSLIVLGIINGGLGIRLASFSPFRTDAQTRTAGIVYGTIAGAMFALYAVLVVLFEMHRRRAQRKAATAYSQNKAPPTYDESESSATSVASRQNTSNNVPGTTSDVFRYS